MNYNSLEDYDNICIVDRVNISTVNEMLNKK